MSILEKDPEIISKAMANVIRKVENFDPNCSCNNCIAMRELLFFTRTLFSIYNSSGCIPMVFTCNRIRGLINDVWWGNELTALNDDDMVAVMETKAKTFMLNIQATSSMDSELKNMFRTLYCFSYTLVQLLIKVRRIKYSNITRSKLDTMISNNLSAYGLLK